MLFIRLTFVSRTPLDVGHGADGLYGIVRRRGSGVGENVPNFDEFVPAGGGEAVAFFRVPIDGENGTMMTLNMKLRFVRTSTIPYLNVS